MTLGRDDLDLIVETEFGLLAVVLPRPISKVALDAIALRNFRRVSFTGGYYNGPQQLRYSYLSATRGSTLVARRAGIRHATKATSSKTIGTATKVAMSVGVTPNSKFDIRRVTA
jgi:hypothetical protein